MQMTHFHGKNSRTTLCSTFYLRQVSRSGSACLSYIMSTNIEDDTLVSNKRESQSTTSKLTDTNVYIYTLSQKNVIV